MNNKTITVNKIIEICNGELISGDGNVVVNSYSKDSRDINNGDMYIAIKGDRLNGNNYIESAFENGAIGCITDEEINTKKLEKISHKIIIKVEDTVKAIQKIAKYMHKIVDL